MAGAVTHNGHFASLWASALDLYERRTGRDLKSDPSIQSIKTLEDLGKKTDQSSQEFGDFRERHARLWKAISTVCAPIQMVGGVAQSVLAASQIQPAYAAFGAIFHLVQSAKGVSDAYDAVEDLLCRIGTATQRFQQYSQGDISESLGMLVTEIMCKTLEILARAEKLAKRPRAQEFFRVAFLGKDEKPNSLLRELERLSSEEARLVLALVDSSTQRMEKGIEDLNVQIGQSRTENESTTDRQRMAALLYATLSDRMYEIYRSIGRDRVHGTGEWILDDTLMEKWLEWESAFLSILGVGGIGNSYLSGSIIDELEKRKVPYQSVA